MMHVVSHIRDFSERVWRRDLDFLSLAVGTMGIVYLIYLRQRMLKGSQENPLPFPKEVQVLTRKEVVPVEMENSRLSIARDDYCELSSSLFMRIHGLLQQEDGDNEYLMGLQEKIRTLDLFLVAKENDVQEGTGQKERENHLINEYYESIEYTAIPAEAFSPCN